MPLSEIEQKKAEFSLAKYCDAKTSQALKSQLEIVFRVEGNFAYISEKRPNLRNPDEVMVHDVAKFRFVVKDRVWVLYWCDSNLNWHVFDEAKPSKDVSALFNTVDSHPIFYG